MELRDGPYSTDPYLKYHLLGIFIIFWTTSNLVLHFCFYYTLSLSKKRAILQFYYFTKPFGLHVILFFFSYPKKAKKFRTEFTVRKENPQILNDKPSTCNRKVLSPKLIKYTKYSRK